MANPYLPLWEYIPDGEPRVFGDRLYVYGSHDRVSSPSFCDYKLKVWSASIDDLNHFVCHGDVFKTRSKDGGKTSIDYSDKELYAPDVVEKDGKYYLFAYVLQSKGCVAVSDHPEGPFEFIGQYDYNIDNHYDEGTFIDPGVLVDDDGRVYVYCGYLGSYMCEIDPNDMHTVIDETYVLDIIPTEEPFEFFEACSPRKVGDTYYLIYSPKQGSRLAYATSDSPRGPFTYRGYIVDNDEDYPAGNDHGSIMKIKDQWYIFYHKNTNGTIMSRRGCVEKIDILPDGSITKVEMTSLGFQDSLNPYEITQSETACVLKGPGNIMITELDIFTRAIINITSDSVMGWKYFDFGDDYTDDEYMYIAIKMQPLGCAGKIHIYADSDTPENEIGVAEFSNSDHILKTKVKKLTGRHAIYMMAEHAYRDIWSKDCFEKRALFNLIAFVFMK